MLRTLLIIGILLSVLSSCSESSKKQGGLYYTTDIDALTGWYMHPTLFKTDKAHSGTYVSKVDSIDVYSLTFDLANKAVNEQYNKVKEVKVTAWVMTNSKDARGSLVTEMRKGDEVIHWSEIKIQDFCNQPDQWCKLEKVLKLDEGDLGNNDNRLRTYLVNSSKAVILLDDITVEYVN